MATVAEEILAKTGVKKKVGEKKQVFLAKVLRAVNELPEEEWAALSEAAQQWSNDAVQALEDKVDILDFPKAGKPKTKAAAAEPDVEPEAPAEAATVPDEPKVEPKKTAKTAPKKKKGSTVRLKELMVLHEDWDKQKVFDTLLGEGFSLATSTFETMFYDTRTTLEVIKRLKG